MLQWYIHENMTQEYATVRVKQRQYTFGKQSKTMYSGGKGNLLAAWLTCVDIKMISGVVEESQTLA